MNVHPVEQGLSEIADLCAEMIAKARETKSSVDMWEFLLRIGMHRKFLDELANDRRLKAQLVAKRADELLESAIIIAKNPHSRSSRRLIKRMDRCLASIDKHLPELVRR
ncbi:hypothetical protein [Aneurinibacillus sp. REN35]|uniref:hypothetical protein n=1 Tax=Aneurinibacillus sp. REN35 TaxID=3237286 RepID=UPI003529830F